VAGPTAPAHRLAGLALVAHGFQGAELEQDAGRVRVVLPVDRQEQFVGVQDLLSVRVAGRQGDRADPRAGTRAGDSTAATGAAAGAGTKADRLVAVPTSPPQ